MDGNGMKGANPHDMMRVNILKGRMGNSKHLRMGAPGSLGRATGGHHGHHGPPGVGRPGGGGGGMMGAGGPAPGAGSMGGMTFPAQGGF